MRVLFEESRAAAQCRDYAEQQGYSNEQAKSLLDRAYELSKKGPPWGEPWTDERWVTRCLDNDKHKIVGLTGLFHWASTVEGEEFWRRVCMALQRAV